MPSDAVRHWKTAIFPKIKAEAAEVGATIYFADEAGIRSDYHSHTCLLYTSDAADE